MEFACSTCHQPHGKVLPTEQDCLRCHGAIAHVGRHELHRTQAGLACKDCHAPHVWRIDEMQAKTLCTRCHDYRPPASFLAAD